MERRKFGGNETGGGRADGMQESSKNAQLRNW
jgi:hypothetical protein